MLEGRTYVPLLHLRLAEVRALTELPTVIKNQTFPLIRVRPWLTARSLDRAFEKINESFGDRFFGFDLDPTRNLPDRDGSAYDEFRRLFDMTGGFAHYYDQCAAIPFAVPVLRAPQGNVLHLEEQVERAREIGRGLVIRVEAVAPFDVGPVLNACVQRGLDDRITVVDGGWARDLLARAAICVGLAQRIVEIDPDAELVIAGGSFPQDFAKLGEHFRVDAFERPLFNEVRRQLNAGRITFGDWASTRPPSDPVPMRNVPRIDVADLTAWECWRGSQDTSYQVLAAQAARDLALTDEPDLWGEYMIVTTAGGMEPSIKSAAAAAAVRINLHMVRQATFDLPGLVIGDEPVGDDL